MGRGASRMDACGAARASVAIAWSRLALALHDLTGHDPRVCWVFPPVLVEATAALEWAAAALPTDGLAADHAPVLRAAAVRVREEIAARFGGVTT